MRCYTYGKWPGTGTRRSDRRFRTSWCLRGGFGLASHSYHCSPPLPAAARRLVGRWSGSQVCAVVAEPIRVYVCRDLECTERRSPAKKVVLLLYMLLGVRTVEHTQALTMAAFYLQAATILDQLEQKNDSLKALVAKTSGDRETAQNQRKRLLAVCANTLAYKQVLSLALDRSTILRSPAAVQALKKGGAQPPGNSGGNGSAERTAGGGGPSRKKQKLVSGAVNSAPSQSSSAPTSQSLLLVLLHDLLISGKIQTAQTYPPTAFLMANKARLHAELVRIQINKGVPSLIGLRSDQEQRAKVARIPRWIRLNTPKLSGTGNGDASARESFEAWLEAGRKGLTKCSAEENVLPSKRNYAESHHIRNVYALPSSYTSQLLASEPYQDGQVILQDLASCFPAQILVDHFERHHIARKKKGKANSGVALDATAAPGNKTSHLSALLHELCKKHQSLSISLTALEHDQGRFRTLRSQMQKAGTLSGNEKPTGVSSKPKSPTSLAQGPGALNVECRKQDFLATDPTTEGSDWARTVMLMLDPSCSGSGILGRLDQ